MTLIKKPQNFANVNSFYDISKYLGKNIYYS